MRPNFCQTSVCDGIGTVMRLCLSRPFQHYPSALLSRRLDWQLSKPINVFYLLGEEFVFADFVLAAELVLVDGVAAGEAKPFCSDDPTTTTFLHERPSVPVLGGAVPVPRWWFLWLLQFWSWSALWWSNLWVLLLCLLLVPLPWELWEMVRFLRQSGSKSARSSCCKRR